MISIIIPMYNAEKYIDGCLTSILNSTYKNFEIIIVNDGSTDNTNKILKNYSVKDKRIKIINKENGGSASARNVGVKNAKGDFIVFIDSDDYIHKDYLKILYETAIKYNSDLVECDFHIVNNNKKIQDINVKIENMNIRNINNFQKLDEICERKTYLKSIVLWNKIYKTKLFKDIYFVENKGIDDEFIIHKIIYKAKKISIIDAKLYYYYLSDNSQMRSIPSLKKIDNIEAIENQMLFFQEKGLITLKEKLYYRYYKVLNDNIGYLKHYFPNEKEKISELKEKRKTWYKAIFSKNVYFKDKIYLILCYTLPKLSNKIHDIFIGENLISINK